MNEDDSQLKIYSVRTIAVIAFCAAVVMLMRTRIIPSTVGYGDISFPLSDFFIRFVLHSLS